MSGGLAGRRVLVTRAAGQAEELAAELAGRGAEVIVVPVLAFVEPASWDAADAALAGLPRYDAVAFASANAVKRFDARRRERGVSWPATVRVFAVGPRTAEEIRRLDGAPAPEEIPFPRVRAPSGASPDPSEHAGEVLARTIALILAPLAGKRLLVPRAEVAREALVEGLRAEGAEVDAVAVYRTVIPPEAAAQLSSVGEVDAVTFASGSAVAHVVEILGGSEAARRRFEGVLVSVLGPVTAERARELGLPPQVVAPEATSAALAAALEERLK